MWFMDLEEELITFLFALQKRKGMFKLRENTPKHS